MSRDFIWRQLAFPPGVEPEAVHAALVGLAGLPTHPQIALEATGTNRVVSWRVGCRPARLSAVLDVLHAHLGDLRVSPLREGTSTTTDTNISAGTDRGAGATSVPPCCHFFSGSSGDGGGSADAGASAVAAALGGRGGHHPLTAWCSGWGTSG